MNFYSNTMLRLFMTALFFLSLLTACSSTVSTNHNEGYVEQTGSTSAEPSNTKRIEEHYGIEIVALRNTAAGHMLDFRFRAVDLEKAMPFFREDIKPYLIDQASGKSLTVPVPAKLGPMRPTGRNPKLGVTYWMFFGNPGLIKSGDRVTIAVGDLRIENLVVE